MSTVSVDPTFTIDQLNAKIAEQENYLRGPLTKIGNSGGNTTLDIASVTGKPAKNAMITTGTPPAASTTIDTAQVYLVGALNKVTAYRPT